jgi:hypothetical protein
VVLAARISLHSTTAAAWHELFVALVRTLG